jgi:uroporphyrinogen decarboxylase
VLEALDHQESDRAPVDFGGTSVSGIHVDAYADLLHYMYLDNLDVKLFDPMMQLAMVDQDVRDTFAVDTQKLYRPAPKFGIPIYDGWTKGTTPKGRPCLVPMQYNPVEDEDGYNIISGGRVIARRPKSSLYFDLVYNPLKGRTAIEDLKDFSLPAYSEADLQYLSMSAAANRQSGDKAVITAVGGSFREKTSDLMGFQEFMMAMVLNRKYVEYLFDLLVENYKRNFDQLKAAVGNNVDILKVTDDLGMKTGLMFSPDLYRSLFKPRQKELIEYFKKDSDYKILLHCDGNITQIIPDLIEIGVDAIDPVDTSAIGMDPLYLKKTFGREITFWGGLIEPANMVALGVDQIKNYVKKRLDILAPGGGFVYAYTHNVQPDVSPEKVVGFFEAVKEWGRDS